MFGSWARVTQTRGSDIDRMIISNETRQRYFDRYNDFDGLYEVFGNVVLDQLIYNGRELSEMTDRPLSKPHYAKEP